ncbi:MAG: NADH-quinone oxidoreductase subunit L [Candidatus Micrarchaeota archaeon]|nr:NADH-quinone oxidoreductase subunit L [Candidatus Micrarchaeota archaeon]
MLEIYVIAPLAVSAVVALLARNRKSMGVRYLALAASMLSLLMIIASYPANAGQLHSITWFGFSGYSFAITISTMPLNMLLLFIVGIMTPLILLYSIGFMDVPSEQSRYYAEICIFAAAMMIFSIAGDFITMMIGWELLGISSYLLIGFWYHHEGAPQAARKAATTVLIGDVMMLAAMLIIWNAYHTFVFSQLINSQVTSMPMEISLVLVMLAVFTKSAQFPFHEWLPDAMKGPTPVSAFLHSSTMVKAGVFLVAVLLPLFSRYHMLPMLLVFGLVTAILGVSNALAENNLKRVLAYSTIEDLGLMFVALGTGSLPAAMMLFAVQTFYKALLFMSAGSIMKANGYEEELDRLYVRRSYLQLLIPTVIGVVSLAGIYPLSGFFGKSAVYAATGNLWVYAILLMLETGSSIYIFRWLLIPMRKKPEKVKSKADANYVTLPKSMLLPIYMLAALAAAAGIVIYHYMPAYLGQQGIPAGALDIAVSGLISTIGFIAAFYLFYKRPISRARQDLIHKLLYNNAAANRAYSHIAAIPIMLSRAVESLDYSLYNSVKGAGRSVNESGNLLKRLETGNINTYIAVFVLGMLVMLAIFIL